MTQAFFRHKPSLIASDTALEELLQSIEMRDTSAFLRLKAATTSMLYGIAHRMLRDRADAEEVVGEVFIRVWYRHQQFDPCKGTARGWLAAVCRNAAIDSLRRSHRQRAAFRIHAAIPADVYPSPDTFIEEAELFGLILRGIEQLPEVQRQMLGLCFWDGMSHREISRARNVPLGTVKSHLSRSVKRLQQDMTGRLGTPTRAHRCLLKV